MKPEAHGITLGQAIDEFLATLRHDKNTQKTYSAGLSALRRFLTSVDNESAAEISVSSLGENVLEGFCYFLQDAGYSRFTVRTYLAAASSFLSYMLSHDKLAPSFSLAKARAMLRRSMKRFPYPAPVPDPALPLIVKYYDEIDLPTGNARQQRLARLRLLRSRAIVHTLYSSAGRIAEVTALDRRDVADGRQPEVVVTGKGHKQRFIYLTADAQKAISDYVSARQDAYQPLFISHGRNYGTRLSKVSVWQTVKTAARALDMDVSPHDFRHYRARQMLDEGAPLEAIQDILGHSDIGTTRKVYAIYSRTSVREIFARATLTPDEALRKSMSSGDRARDGWAGISGEAEQRRPE